jgi:hypothetical protein
MLIYIYIYICEIADKNIDKLLSLEVRNGSRRRNH